MPWVCLKKVARMAEKPLRDAMPTVAGWIDSLREAFGSEPINRAIRNGLGGGSHFYAEESGRVLGVEAMPGRHVVTAADMVLAKPEGDK